MFHLWGDSLRKALYFMLLGNFWFNNASSIKYKTLFENVLNSNFQGWVLDVILTVSMKNIVFKKLDLKKKIYDFTHYI